MNDCRIIVIAGIFCTGLSLYAQPLLKTFRAEIKPFQLIIDRQNPQAGGVIIKSDVPNLRFEGNLGIQKIDFKGGGEWYLYLPVRQTNVITIKADGYKNCEVRVYVRDSKEFTPIELFGEQSPRKGFLTVLGSPPDAQVFINGAGIEKVSTCRRYPLSPDTYNLLIKCEPLFEPESRTIVIKSDEETMQRIDLTKRKGAITVLSDPEDAVIYLDNKEANLRTNLYRHPVEFGDYFLSIKKVGYVDPPSRKCTIKTLEEQKFDFGKLRSLGEISREKARSWHIQTYLGLFSFLSCGAYAGYQYYEYDKDYQKYTQATSTADAKDLRKSMDEKELQVYGFAAASGISLIYYLICNSVYKHHMREAGKYSFHIMNKNGNTGLLLCCNF